MPLSLDDLRKIAEEHFNELVIDYSFNVVRFVGYAETADDYYYMVKNTYGKPEYSYATCVGSLIYLKDRLDENDYKNLDETLALNRCAKEESVIFKNLIE